MDFILGGVSKLIKGMAMILKGFSWTHNIGTDLEAINPYLKKANILLPMDAALTVLSLYITVQLCLVAYYWITRAINLLRGAG